MITEQTSQTSRLVSWMIKSGPEFCSLAQKIYIDLRFCPRHQVTHIPLIVLDVEMQ